MIIQLILMIAIGGMIGYLTNKIAVKMLFRPIEPKRFLFFKFQGLLPKRKDKIGTAMGETIEAAFLTKDDIVRSFMSDELAETFKEALKDKLTTKIYRLMPKMVQNMFGQSLEAIIRQYIDQEGDAMIEELFDVIKEQGMENLNIKGIVKDKVDALDFVAFEALVVNIVKKELRHIEFVGLILGMIIGSIQFFLTLFL